MNLFVIFLLNMLMETEMSLSYKLEYKKEIKLFSHNKLKFQTRT